MSQEYVLIEKTELTSIADKVRSVSGSTEAMNVLDIGANLETEVESVKETLTTWLTDSGTEVPEGTNVAGLVELIAGIEVGSGGTVTIEGFDFCKSGVITFAEPVQDSYTFTIDTDPDWRYKTTFFILIRLGDGGTRGITTIGELDVRPYSTAGSAKFGGYMGGAGANNNNLNYHGIQQGDDQHIFDTMSYIVTCSSNAPLSADTYVWLWLAN